MAEDRRHQCRTEASCDKGPDRAVDRHPAEHAQQAGHLAADLDLRYPAEGEISAGFRQLGRIEARDDSDYRQNGDYVWQAWLRINTVRRNHANTIGNNDEQTHPQREEPDQQTPEDLNRPSSI